MAGVRQFKNESFKQMEAIFAKLSEGQHPDILFITCSDSRVIPTLLTQSKPGALFVIRNVGNIIPPDPTISSEAAAIEYAISVLNVKDIIVCGHTDCGAMKGLLHASLEKKLPAVSSWLKHSAEILKDMKDYPSGGIDNPLLQLEIITKKNVLAQMEHLKTYPMIQEKMARHELNLHGWYYKLSSGEVLIHNPQMGGFIDFDKALELSIQERRNDIVKEIVIDFLEPLTHPKTSGEYNALMHLLSQVQENIAIIWPHIRTRVLQALWNELGCLYSDPEDPKFVALTNLESRLPLGDLKNFQGSIERSPGYQQFCSHLIRQSWFSKHITPLHIRSLAEAVHGPGTVFSSGMTT